MEAEEYRRRARRCLIVARQIADYRKRAMYIDMAATWMLFAHRAERRKPIIQQQQQMQPKKDAGTMPC